MEEKKQIKISLKIAIIIVCIIAAIFIIFIANIFLKDSNKIQALKENNNFYIEENENKKYYIISDDYSGDYDLQFLNLYEYNSKEIEDFMVETTMDYSNYSKYCEKWNINKKYSNKNSNYIVFSYASKGSPILEARLAGVEYKEKNAILYVWDHASGYTADTKAYVIIIPTKKDITSIEIQNVYELEEYYNIIGKSPIEGTNYDDVENFLNNAIENSHKMPAIHKPIIYLYPTKEIELNVKLGYPDKITCSYPKYKTGWNVLAKPNGDITDLDSGRNLYSLYYESNNVVNFDIKEDGFIVKGTEIIEFLEEKLAILGLTEREAEEFIVYWLPRLQENKYNYIRFATMEEINANMPLEFSTKPDSIIRVIMTYKGLDNPIEVEEQQLETPERTGFVAVEWGGTEMK